MLNKIPNNDSQLAEVDGNIMKEFCSTYGKQSDNENLNVRVVNPEVLDVVKLNQLCDFVRCREVIGISTIAYSDSASFAQACHEEKGLSYSRK
ncbi:Glucan endo-1 [Psidium guajava]|nr:Glucan endo-1 [Psidium guajava]